MKYHSISMDQARYATYIVAKYLDTATVKASTKVYRTTLPSYMIFTKVDASTSDEQSEKGIQHSLQSLHWFINLFQHSIQS